jgi:hypothetical protein
MQMDRYAVENESSSMAFYSVKITLPDNQHPDTWGHIDETMEELGYSKEGENNSFAIYGCDFFGIADELTAQINESTKDCTNICCKTFLSKSHLTKRTKGNSSRYRHEQKSAIAGNQPR